MTTAKHTWPVPVAGRDGLRLGTLVWRHRSQHYVTLVAKATYALGADGGARPVQAPAVQPFAEGDHPHEVLPALGQTDIIVRHRARASSTLRLAMYQGATQTLAVTAAAEAMAALSPAAPPRAAALARIRGGRLWQLPDEFDWDAFQSAPPAQRVPFVSGAEWITVAGESVTARFCVPLGPPEWTLQGVSASPVVSPTALDTIVLDLDTGTATVLWRARIEIETPAELISMRVAARMGSSGSRRPSHDDEEDEDEAWERSVPGSASGWVPTAVAARAERGAEVRVPSIDLSRTLDADDHDVRRVGPTLPFAAVTPRRRRTPPSPPPRGGLPFVSAPARPPEAAGAPPGSPEVGPRPSSPAAAPVSPASPWVVPPVVEPRISSLAPSPPVSLSPPVAGLVPGGDVLTPPTAVSPAQPLGPNVAPTPPRPLEGMNSAVHHPPPPLGVEPPPPAPSPSPSVVAASFLPTEAADVRDAPSPRDAAGREGQGPRDDRSEDERFDRDEDSDPKTRLRQEDPDEAFFATLTRGREEREQTRVAEAEARGEAAQEQRAQAIAEERTRARQLAETLYRFRTKK
ncbi:MAG: hypothetical protein AAF715_05930 [Myxococcota bacterium]